MSTVGSGVAIPHKYDLSFDVELTDLTLELHCFRIAHPIEKGGLGPEGHFKNVCTMLWNKNTKNFVWHPWADRMLEEACKHKYLAISGAASSGKTAFAAIWALVSWLCDPVYTMVLVTSTSLKESRKRIWGAIREYYMAPQCLPGKLVDSVGIIRLRPEDAGGAAVSDRCGITLIPGEKKKEKEAIGKLIGMKNQRVIMIADELPELSEAIIQAGYSNLSSNPHFQLMALGNFNSMYDAFGQFAKPKDGYSSINAEMDGWETERGYCLRFDGLKSPNFAQDKDVWPIYGRKQLKEHQKIGSTTAAFWRMCRSFPCPAGEEFTIYSEADLIRGQVDQRAQWRSGYTNVAFLDPAFTSGGDRAVVYFARYGAALSGKMTIEFTEYLVLNEDVQKQDQSRNFQIAQQYKQCCLDRGVSVQNAGCDVSGPGIVFGEILAQIWSPRFYRVQFGGAPTTMPVGSDDPKPAAEVYYNRVSEIWHVGLDFVRGDQIRGLCPEAAKELKARRYDTVKQGTLKIRVEPKIEMKHRTGKSPDIGDSACGVIDLCRNRFGAVADSTIIEAASEEWLAKAVEASDIFPEEDQIFSPTADIWD